MIDIPAYMVKLLATRTYVGDRACQRCDGFGWIGTARASPTQSFGVVTTQLGHRIDRDPAWNSRLVYCGVETISFAKKRGS